MPSGIIILFGALAVFLAIPWGLTLWLRPPAKPGTFWLQLSCLYCGFLSVLAGAGYGAMGLLGDVFNRTSDQWLSWMALVLGFLMPGTLMLIWAYTAKVIVTETGLEQYGPLGRRTWPWGIINTVSFKPQSGFRVLSGKRRLVTIPPGSGDIAYFLAECERHNVPVLGSEPNTGKSPT